ncbi:phosphatidic acid phosphatase type 2/haloperoxidase [Mycotypha africana]|uniref:phosphatidic acid phosphatase type 2/haloperoxidase n=1 Tax=Mycotypha africana TaxID=64632 RepID=UPI0023008F37|nr:phosphatidic acid phosphatase type 2/haloperoxidase [Mycotypha africana]KAI8975316.1 phosphatidic acid phosphatase type 2/haloperoxidase [Mycotypha africana]
MARKMFKTIEADVDAGTQDDRLYNKAFDKFRSSLRNTLLPLIRKETPILAAMQKKIRSPGLDTYFIWTANLGTHTFFMVFLPILIWFGNDEIGRNIAILTASGVFWSGFVKDFLCLPRPLSPPVHRLTMSPSVALEYGFPSTHSTNSIQVALFFISLACEKFTPESPARMISIIACTIYAVSVVFGRVYCGMHSVTDCVGGTILAYILYWVQWTFREQINYLLTDQSSYWVLLGIPLILMLVSLHPDPMERCPCFEDSVCFMGVLIGLLPGTWLCYGSDVCVKGLSSSIISMQLGLLGSLLLILKLVIGVACLFIWRIACKKLCYFILPPIYRVFNLPHRKFEIGARTYKSLRRESIHPVPSVLDFQSISNYMDDHEHVGIQSAIDLKEAQNQQLSHRGNNNGQHQHMPISTSVPEKEAFDPTSLLVLEDAPLRYDVDIVTKLIVYAGIGFIATFVVPIIFRIMSNVL